MKIQKPPKKAFLNRYTSLPILLDILVHKRIVLLSPSLWEDRNDSYYLERYRMEKKLKTLLALCFSKKRETFHHWKVFSSGSGGVCIEFDKEQLLGPLRSRPGIRLGNVTYLYIKNVQKRTPSIAEWPFLKRKPYEDEAEFRIIYENRTDEVTTKDIQIQIAAISKVTLSPWMPKGVAETIKKVIGGISGCEKLKIQWSALLETAKWKAAIKSTTEANAQQN